MWWKKEVGDCCLCSHSLRAQLRKQKEYAEKVELVLVTERKEELAIKLDKAQQEVARYEEGVMQYSQTVKVLDELVTSIKENADQKTVKDEKETKLWLTQQTK